MKRIFFCSIALSYFALSACNKTKHVADAPNQKKLSGISATQLNPFVVEAAYTRDMIIHSGKFDCSTNGKNCRVPKGKSNAQIQQLAVLDDYILEHNTAGYFKNNEWRAIFPELTDEGLAAIADGRLHIYKRESVDETHSYVLSLAQSEDELSGDNIICVWQF